MCTPTWRATRRDMRVIHRRPTRYRPTHYGPTQHRQRSVDPRRSVDARNWHARSKGSTSPCTGQQHATRSTASLTPTHSPPPHSPPTHNPLGPGRVCIHSTACPRARTYPQDTLEALEPADAAANFLRALLCGVVDHVVVRGRPYHHLGWRRVLRQLLRVAPTCACSDSGAAPMRAWVRACVREYVRESARAMACNPWRTTPAKGLEWCANTLLYAYGIAYGIA